MIVVTKNVLYVHLDSDLNRFCQSITFIFQMVIKREQEFKEEDEEQRDYDTNAEDDKISWSHDIKIEIYNAEADLMSKGKLQPLNFCILNVSKFISMIYIDFSLTRKYLNNILLNINT